MVSGYILIVCIFFIFLCKIWKKIIFVLSVDDRASGLYSEPNVDDLKPPQQEEYAEPVDSLQPSIDPDDIQGNPIYEGIYSEPLYGIAGTILVGPQV